MYSHYGLITVNILKICTPENIVIILNLNTDKCVQNSNSVDPDQTAPEGTVDLGLHCFLRPVGPG